MTLGWKTVKRPALTVWGLIIVSLLSSGCRLHSGTCFQRLVNPRVCPTCPAVSIEKCQCFLATENAGYCETTWASLDPMMDTLHNAPDYSYSEPVEELDYPYSEPAEEFSPQAPPSEELAYRFEHESSDPANLISIAAPVKIE